MSSFLFWFMLILLMECANASQVSQAPTVLFSLVVALSSLVGFGGLELTAMTVIAVYASVFLIIYLLMIVTAPNVDTPSTGAGLSCVMVSAAAAVCGSLSYPQTTDVGWADLFSEVRVHQSDMTLLMHQVLMRVFLLEAWLINFVLLLALTVALVTLKVEVSAGLNSRAVTVGLSQKSLWSRNHSSTIK